MATFKTPSTPPPRRATISLSISELDRTSSELSESVFLRKYYEIISSSVWIALVILGRVFITICIRYMRTSFNFIDSSAVICREQTLIDNGWSFEQMSEFLQYGTHGKICQARDYNYTMFKNMSYNEAVEKVKNMPHPSLKDCSDTMYNHHASMITVEQDFDLVCDTEGSFRILYFLIGCSWVAGGFVFGIAADLFGRRITSLVCCCLWLILSCFLATSKSLLIVKILYTLTNTFAVGVYVATYVNVAELTTPSLRFTVMFTDMGFLVGESLALYLQSQVYSWRNLIWYMIVCLLPCIFYCWYLPESPRWLINKRKKQEANGVLAQLQSRVRIRGVDVTDRKTFTLRYMFWFLLRRKRVALFVMLIFVIFAVGTLRSYSLYALHYELAHLYVYRVVSIWLQYSSFLYFIPIYVIFGKRIGLFILTMKYGLALVLGIFLQELINSKGVDQYFFIIGSLLSHSATIMMRLYVVEFFPTFVRCMNLGIIVALDGVIRLLYLYVGGFVKAMSEIEAAPRSSLILDLVTISFSMVGWLILLLPQTRRVELPNYKLYYVM